MSVCVQFKGLDKGGARKAFDRKGITMGTMLRFYLECRDLCRRYSLPTADQDARDFFM